MNNSLYATQVLFINASLTCRITRDGKWSEVISKGYGKVGMAKFLKISDNMVLCRPFWNATAKGLVEFDGKEYTIRSSGINDSARCLPATDAMLFDGDNVLAGFREDARLWKYDLLQKSWAPISSPLPPLVKEDSMEKLLDTDPTVIEMYEDRIFVATHCNGVMELKSGNWEKLGEGEKSDYIDGTKFNNAIIAMKKLGEYIWIGYGRPGYASYHVASTGVMKIKIK